MLVGEGGTGADPTTHYHVVEGPFINCRPPGILYHTKKPTIQLLLYFLRIFGSRVTEPSLWPGSGFGGGFSFILSPRALGLPIFVAVAQASAPALETATNPKM